MNFKLYAIEKRSGSFLGYDKENVTKVGTSIRLEGTNGSPDIRVVKHDAYRKLLYTKHKGYTSYIDRGSGNRYMPARFVVYEYEEEIVGNEIHLNVDLFGIAELPLSWKPPTNA